MSLLETTIHQMPEENDLQNNVDDSNSSNTRQRLSPLLDSIPASATSARASISSTQSDTPFFADAVLDLDEAHDIAETPESVHRIQSISNERALDIPNNSTPFVTTNQKIGNIQNNNVMHEIIEEQTKEKTRFSRITFEVDHDTRPMSVPRWPRDFSWAVAFCLFTPTALLWPLVAPLSSSPSPTKDLYNNTTVPAAAIVQSPFCTPPLSTATLHALGCAAVATFVLSRVLYRSLAGGDGDEARHLAAQVLLLSAPLSVGASMVLAFFLWWACPTARITVLVPIWYIIRDMYLFRRWKRRNDTGTILSSTPTSLFAGRDVSGGMAANRTSSRQAFFQALTCMALDILSRSLRRASFYRVLLALLFIQLGVLMLWRWALLATLARLGQVGAGHYANLIFILTAIAGKWATGFVARLLTLLACGGVTGWFMEQSALLEALPESDTKTSNEEDGVELHPVGRETKKNGALFNSMPEAYRSADASMYHPVLTLDDALDDDYEAEEEEFLESPYRRKFGRRDQVTTATNTSTVKNILWAGLTVSFGSVAICGLLGGPAQFVWSQVRKIEATQVAISNARHGNINNTSVRSGFRGMRVGNDSGLINRLYNYIIHLARLFVRSYSDLAMTHVAGYYKNYQRAARDVAVLIDESGVEPILHEDISTHMCACVGGTISVVVVIITTYIMLHQIDDNVSDWRVSENMLLSFILCYTLVFTVMEPLRAAIKAVYVSFAQHPRSLSQAFPLVFHRLSRLSESNMH